jgi:hypothetical protein
MTKKTAKDIIEESLPDLELVNPPHGRRTMDPTQGITRPGASLAELRKKYLGTSAADVSISLAEDAIVGGGSEDDVEVKQVRSRQTAADPADDPGPRAIIVSKTAGILGAQG